MAGKMLSTANLKRVQDTHDHMAAMGAQCGGSAKWARKAADQGLFQGLFERVDAVRRAMLAVVTIAEANVDHGYPYLEDVYDSYCIIGMGETYWRADYLLAADGSATLAARDTWQQVEEVWQPVPMANKAGLNLPELDSMVATMKAAGDRQLEVIVAYGSPKSKDSHGEYFSPRTDFAVEDFPTPPLIYYHGADQRTNRPMTKPVSIGKMQKRWSDADGHHLLYHLKSNAHADRVWADACNGAIPASPGTVGYLARRESDGELTYWPLAEISAWDRAGGRKQAYHHTVGVAALKALYVEDGIAVPSLLTSPPEALGNGAGAVVDTESVKQVIAAAIAATMRKRTRG